MECKDHNRIHKTLLLDPILSQPIPIQILASYFLKLFSSQLSVSLPSDYFPLFFRLKLYTLLLFPLCCMSRPYHLLYLSPFTSIPFGGEHKVRHFLLLPLPLIHFMIENSPEKRLMESTLTGATGLPSVAMTSSVWPSMVSFTGHTVQRPPTTRSRYLDPAFTFICVYGVVVDLVPICNTQNRHERRRHQKTKTNSVASVRK